MEICTRIGVKLSASILSSTGYKWGTRNPSGVLNIEHRLIYALKCRPRWEDVIRECTSPWYAPAILVTKRRPDGNQNLDSA